MKIELWPFAGARAATVALFGACAACSTAESPAALADAGGESAAPDASVPEAAANIGAIFAVSDSTVVDGGAHGSYRAGAFFALGNGVDPTVTTKTVGPCLIETYGDGTPPAETATSAGAVHIAGGKKVVAIVPKADKQYDAVTGTDSLWIGGETLTVTSDGADVPAFTTSLVAPSKITLTAPGVSGNALKIARNTPLEATWTGASNGVVVLYFDATNGTAAYAATCTFKPGDGAGQVPAAAFADFPAGSGTFDFYVKETSEARPGDYSVRFTASSAIVDPGGSAAAGGATFQ